jgi:hypothetical protein
MADMVHLEGLKELAILSEKDISPPQGSLASEWLPLAVAQFAIMSATPTGEVPETIGERLTRLAEDQAELDTENFFSQVLSEEEKKHLRAANVVIGLVAEYAEHTARHRGLIG